MKKGIYKKNIQENKFILLLIIRKMESQTKTV